MNRDGVVAIYEVYYYEDGRTRGYSAEPTFPAGETVEELQINCDLYLAALGKPVLEYSS
jgi:hypothetical protein